MSDVSTRIEYGLKGIWSPIWPDREGDIFVRQGDEGMYSLMPAVDLDRQAVAALWRVAKAAGYTLVQRSVGPTVEVPEPSDTGVTE